MKKTKNKETVERSRPGSLGRLYDLLDESFPGHRTRLGFLSVNQLAKDLGVTPQALYKSFGAETIHARYVRPLMNLSKGRLTLEKIAPFVFE